MNTTTIASAPNPMVDAPSWFKVTATIVFSIGALLHGSNVVFGPERFLRDIFVPSVEVIFSLLMTIATIAGWMSWSRFTGGRAMRFAYGFALVFITISVPIHLRSVFIWSTSWAASFPKYYSHAEIPLFLALIWLTSQFRFAARHQS
ncbi:MAG TPA: hypothetical protein PK156_22870 [Polyangium sp.]|nr:hypothetical protein [Polyangium sp.]